MEMPLVVFYSESLQCLLLGSGCEGEVRTVVAHLAVFHQLLNHHVRVASSGVGVVLH